MKILLVLLLLGGSDRVVLRNGDTITGTVRSMTGGTLVVETAYAGVVKVKLDEVRSVRTEEPVTIHLKDGQLVRGTLQEDEEGKVGVMTDGGRIVLGWEDVASINPPPPPPESAWKGSVALGGSQHSGNTDRATASLAAEATRTSKTDRFGIRLLWNYAEEDEVATARNVFGALKYDYFFTERVYGYLSVELLSDEFRDIDLRTFSGFGMGWKAVVGERFNLELELGIAFINESFNVAPDESTTAIRFGLRFALILSKGLTLSNTAVFYSEVGEDGEQTRNETKLTANLRSGWSFVITHVVEHDSEPPPGIRKQDRISVIGLQYTFGP